MERHEGQERDGRRNCVHKRNLWMDEQEFLSTHAVGGGTSEEEVNCTPMKRTTSRPTKIMGSHGRETRGPSHDAVTLVVPVRKGTTELIVYRDTAKWTQRRGEAPGGHLMEHSRERGRKQTEDKGTADFQPCPDDGRWAAPRG